LVFGLKYLSLFLVGATLAVLTSNL